MHTERLIGHLFAVLLLRMCFGCNSVCGSMRWAGAFGTSKKHVWGWRKCAGSRTSHNRLQWWRIQCLNRYYLLDPWQFDSGTDYFAICFLFWSSNLTLSQSWIIASKVTEWFMIFFLVHKVTMGFAVIGVINGALSAPWENEMNSPNSPCDWAVQHAGAHSR